MIRRVTLENFMSHKRTELDLAPGITVLVGPNNCGKSAVVAALSAVCRNDAGTYAIRHGEKTCRVTVTVQEGQTLREVTWVRGLKAVSYLIDAQPIPDEEEEQEEGPASPPGADPIRRIKAGARNLPQRVHQILRLPLAALTKPSGDKEPFEIHFGTQKDPIFLLRDSGAGRRAAQFLGLSSDAGRLIEMQSLHATRTAERQRDRKVALERKAQLEKHVEALAPLAEIRGPLEEAERTFDAIVARDEACTELEALIADLRAAGLQESACAARAWALAGLTSTPDLHDTGRLESTLAQLRPLEARHAQLREVSSAMSALDAPPEQARVAPLEGHLARLREERWREERAGEAAGVFERLALPPEPVETRTLTRAIDALAQAGGVVRGLTERTSALRPLAAPPLVPSERELEVAIATLRAGLDVVDELTRRGDALVGLDTPPTPAVLGPLAELVTALREAQDRSSRVTARAKVLDGLVAPPALQAEQAARTLVEELRRAARAEGQVAGRHAVLDGLVPPPAQGEPQLLRRGIDDLGRALQAFASARDRARLLDDLAAPPALAEVEPIRAARGDLARAAGERAQLERLLAEEAQAVEAARERLRDWAARNQRCPTCGGDVDPDRLAGAEEHGHA